MNTIRITDVVVDHHLIESRFLFRLRKSKVVNVNTKQKYSYTMLYESSNGGYKMLRTLLCENPTRDTRDGVSKMTREREETTDIPSFVGISGDVTSSRLPMKTVDCRFWTSRVRISSFLDLRRFLVLTPSSEKRSVSRSILESGLVVGVMSEYSVSRLLDRFGTGLRIRCI